MSKIGSAIAILGVASIVLYFLDYNLKILMWIDNWGDTMGWIIRVGLVVIGLALMVFGKPKTTEQE